MPPTTRDRHLPNLTQAQHPRDMTPERIAQLISCWVEVTNAGGAVGFPFPPVTTEHVSTAAEQMIAGLDPDHSRLLLAISGDQLVGWLSLSRQPGRLVRHWGVIQRVQTHPDHRDQGIGTALMNRIRQIARDEMGLEQLHLAARGGEGLEDYYTRLGWKEIGRWPDTLRFDHGDRDEILMILKPV